ncbi:hypothetical protein QYM36_019448 [Artemia franciscana]|uniref:MGAT4 conserved region domain-containing protein n=2 Tax=Artemia franciscana TaxID=6661 RepID=A0AA88H582_ARTSF|nr:hypothetical protein QYM36_019448 [Artemia franciscana]
MNFIVITKFIFVYYLTGAVETTPVSAPENTIFLKMPSAAPFLPHLADPNSLRVKIHTPVITGSQYPATLVFGIPTAEREGVSYVSDTLQSLLRESARVEDLLDCKFIVLLASVDEQYVESTYNQIKWKFSSEIEKGILQVISPNKAYYPDWSTLPIRIGDPIERVHWRSKQSLDYALLMEFAKTQGTFYVQLEDDIVAHNTYISQIKKYASKMERKKQKWFVSDLSSLGFIGKMFHSYDLKYMIQFLVMFYNDLPADWMIDPLIESKFCNLEQKFQCKETKNLLWPKHKPSLFQHRGTVSTLKGKVQNLKDPFFE